jgi:hypothetical protein
LGEAWYGLTTVNWVLPSETALREAFETRAHDAGVVFIQSDARGGIVPCAPSKISLSDVVAVRPNDVVLPIDFNTIAHAPSNLLPFSFEGSVLPPVCHRREAGENFRI